jgi:hypothetical protein
MDAFTKFGSVDEHPVLLLERLTNQVDPTFTLR